MRHAESPEEWEAKWVASAILGGVPQRRTPPGHDYDIRVGDAVIALEVTRSAPEERAALHAAIGRLHQRRTDHITMHWQVGIPDAKHGYRGPDLQAIFKLAPPLLRVLEQRGVSGFGPGYERHTGDKPDEVRASIQALHDLGLIAGQSVGPPMLQHDPLLLVGTRADGGAVDANDVNVVVEICAAKKTNQLIDAVATERHLFVVVESTDYPAHPALSVGLHLPDRPPTLPAGIETVWVGAWMPHSWNGCDISPIWKVTPPGPWVRLQAPDAHTYAAKFGESTVVDAEEEARELVRLQLNDYARGIRARIFGRHSILHG